MWIKRFFDICRPKKVTELRRQGAVDRSLKYLNFEKRFSQNYFFPTGDKKIMFF